MNKTTNEVKVIDKKFFWGHQLTKPVQELEEKFQRHLGDKDHEERRLGRIEWEQHLLDENNVLTIMVKSFWVEIKGIDILELQKIGFHVSHIKAVNKQALEVQLFQRIEKDGKIWGKRNEGKVKV